VSNEEKWAVNVAFVCDEKTAKRVLKAISGLEEKGEITDLTGIEGPYNSLQIMLKRRLENLTLGVNTGVIPTQIGLTQPPPYKPELGVNTEVVPSQIGLTQQTPDEPEDDWFYDDDVTSDDDLFEDNDE
jgi:hypothetical protein